MGRRHQTPKEINDGLAESLRQMTRIARERGLHDAADWLLEQCVEGDKDAIDAMFSGCNGEIDRLRAFCRKQQEEIETLNGYADAVERLRDIGKVTGCNHVDSPDGRRQLVNCVEQLMDRLEDRIMELAQNAAESPPKTTRELELEDVLASARAICQRQGADTAWERFDQRIAGLGIGSVTAKVFKVLPSDKEQQ